MAWRGVGALTSYSWLPTIKLELLKYERGFALAQKFRPRSVARVNEQEETPCDQFDLLAKMSSEKPER